MSHLERIRAYFRAIEDAAPFETLRGFFTGDVVQREFPNRLVPNGATRTLADLAEAAERGRTVVTNQRYEILSAIETGDRVAVEVRWTANIQVPIGSIPADGEMAARFAVFFEMRDGRIAVQHNYDCFDPF
ncbi:MAG TPA: nuclear transport factor 2 family protein [Thermoanaerobaculia bacterium]|jgi:ketosteroid isomerase-like protein|nr:nuclear transport factor 2 family protein [Thermoanaerobaculia bacterium]